MTKQDKIVAAIPAHKNIHVALAAAQAEMAPLIKGAVNPHFKKTYADLASVVAASREALSSNGISYHYEIRRHEASLDMVTVFTHGETDTSVECRVPLIVAKNDMQGFKSATTYAKRIGHESLSGLAPEDDDGNDASKSPPPPPKEVNAVSPDQHIKLRDLVQQADANEAAFCTFYEAASLQQFPLARFADAVVALNKKVEKAKPADQNADLGGDEIPYQGAA